MPLFCKQCQSRRLPIVQLEGQKTLWLCEKCKNFTDMEDIIIREQTDEEREIIKKKLDEFEKSTTTKGEKLSRRKGVN